MLGRGSIGCACGFSIDSPAPPPLDVEPPPRRGPMRTLLGAGVGVLGATAVAALCAAMGLLPPSRVGTAVLAAGAVAGVGLLLAGARLRRRRRRWFDSAEIFEDPALRRAVLKQVRALFDPAEHDAARQVEQFLADRGVAAPEFRRAVLARLSGPNSAPS